MAELKERAHRQDIPLEHIVNQILRRGLEADARGTRRKPFRAKTFAMGQPLVPRLDESLAEDEEIARKLALRK